MYSVDRGYYLKIGMQANWNEKYLTQVRYFSHVNTEWKLPHSGETSYLGEGFHII